MTLFITGVMFPSIPLSLLFFKKKKNKKHVEVVCQGFTHILCLKEPHYWPLKRQGRWRRMTRFALIAQLSVVPGAIQAYNNLSRVSVSWKLWLFVLFWQADFLL